ncbi:Rpn family recombination-promoting nuclease/putative transposase [Treponema vincentii]|uniref:Rpn family recombination-promoting nuclease/putative transposase n=1 Tax=Treponema vincentii TaxID=69710 RepID=UPI001E5DC481|nr:Rpn family recombination-promoting nuclease/putative transposase [Treponema vincentii]
MLAYWGRANHTKVCPIRLYSFSARLTILKKTLPVYTFKTICSEDNRIELGDGITKIIINSKAAEHEKNEKLKIFLEYMNGKVSDDEFIQRLERRIKEVKASEELRREYMLVNTIERDARNDGWKAGIVQGLAEGEARGSYQKALETARNLHAMGLSSEKIAQATGLTIQEVEAL